MLRLDWSTVKNFLNNILGSKEPDREAGATRQPGLPRFLSEQGSLVLLEQ